MKCPALGGSRTHNLLIVNAVLYHCNKTAAWGITQNCFFSLQKITLAKISEMQSNPVEQILIQIPEYVHFLALLSS